MKTATLPKDANKTCKCGYIFMGGVTVGVLPKRDDLGRPVVICLSCKKSK